MNTRTLKPLFLLLLALIASLSFGQQKIKWTAHIVSGQMKPGGSATAELDADIEPGWHLYSTAPTKAGNIPTSITVNAPAKLTGPVTEDKPIEKFDANFEAQVKFFENHAKFTVPIQYASDGKATIAVRFQTCNDRTCLPPTTIQVPVGDSSSPAQTTASFGPQKIKWSAHILSGEVNPNGAATAELDADIESGWHLYSTAPTKAGNIPTSITVSAPAKLTGPVTEDKPIEKFDANFEAQVKFFENHAKFTVPIQFSSDGKATIAVRFQTCNDRTCLPPTTIQVPVGDSPTVVQSPSITTSKTGSAGTKTPQDQGLFAFIALAFGAGLLALLTPCVFPMVPITVSYFAKQHEKNAGSSGFAQPVAYCLGIISAFTGFGLIVTILFGASGIQNFATNPVVNLLLAIMFIGLSLNLFGLYEISLPSGITNRFNYRGKSGLIVPVLMGLTFTLTSFTCTVPFVGTILISAAKGQLLYPLVGMLAFSSAFALPFFLLAMFPGYLAKLPKSGSWLAAVKGFMGFLEIAAAIKFFSNADLVWGTGILSRTAFLGVWVVIFIAAALFLLGGLRLPTVNMPRKFGSGRLIVLTLTLIATGFFAYGMTGRSLGEMEAYLPPGKSGWLENYDKALELARRTNKPVFINFTGVTCTNCRMMEKNMFPNPEVKKELNHYVLVELYTDKQSKEDEDNQALQQKLAGTVALPVYLTIAPDGRVISKFESSTRNTGEFLNFLRSGRS